MKTLKGYIEIQPPQVTGEGNLGWRYVYSHAYTKNGCNIWVTRDVHNNGLARWHLSISRRDRYPVWDEIKEARYALIPEECTMAMMLPPKSEYVNLHPNCFHLHEVCE